MYPEGYQDGNWRSQIRKSICFTPDRLRRFRLKIIGWRNWVQKLLEMMKAPHKPNQRPQIQLLEQVDLFRQNNHLVPVLRKSTNVSYLDENEDADQVGTTGPVGSKQSIDLFTQRGETDTDFRVSDLPRAVVKQAENFSVRELVKKIESHPHRQALLKPIYNKIMFTKVMIRDMDNVELLELCETIPKVQCSECFCWNQVKVHCICGHLLRENESSRHLHQWRLDVLSIPNYVIKKVWPHGNLHGKTEEQKEHFIAHNARKRCINKNFKGIHDRFQKDFKISWCATQSSSDWASRWTSWRRKISPIALQLRSLREKKLVYLAEHIWQKCFDETPIKLPWSNNKDAPFSPWVWRRATSTDSFLPVSEMTFVVFQSNTSWWQWNDSWWSS